MGGGGLSLTFTGIVFFSYIEARIHIDQRGMFLNCLFLSSDYNSIDYLQLAI